jgi:hypothetical protein
MLSPGFALSQTVHVPLYHHSDNLVFKPIMFLPAIYTNNSLGACVWEGMVSGHVAQVIARSARGYGASNADSEEPAHASHRPVRRFRQ